MELKPEYEKSIEFLNRWSPEGPWVLTAIDPNKKGTATRTFRAADHAELLRWLEDRGATCNLYVAINPLRHDVTKKADREDVAALAWLAVDLDPRAGEDLTAERERIMDALRAPPVGIPLATAIIDSGGGAWGFWKLKEPVPIDGDLARAEDAKLYNLKLELAFGADHCHDVCRIARLPGTINRPDARKREKGRTEALARVMEWHDDRAYGIEMFEKAAPPRVGIQASVNGKQSPPEAIRRLASVDVLPAAVPDAVKALIVRGCDPDDQAKWADRSRAVFYVCCELLRANVDQDVIVSVITDPSFGISAHVREQRNLERYALRQVERAKDFVCNDAVSRINREYFAVLEGKVVTWYREWPDNSITPMNFQSFDVMLGDESVDDGKGGTRKVRGSSLWKSDPRRRFYPRGFVLDPQNGDNDGQYNLWKGFGVEPKPGDWSMMRSHIQEVLAAGNRERADYIINWTAWSLQHPAERPRVALVFRGGEGVGKGVFCNALCRLFGPHGQRVQSARQVTGQFNAHLQNCCRLFADEACLTDEKGSGVIKGLITESEIAIERKGQDIVQAVNHLHVVMASNHDWVVPAGIDARRFFVVNVSASRKGDRAYFDKLHAEMENGGLAAMLHDLLSIPLGDWRPDPVPDTAALADQKMLGLGGFEGAFLDFLQSGSLPCGGIYLTSGKTSPQATAHVAGSVQVPTVELQVQTSALRREPVTTQAIASLFKKLGFQQCSRHRGGSRGWVVPPLPEARRRWTERCGGYRDWDEATEWEVRFSTPAPREGETETVGAAQSEMAF